MKQLLITLLTIASLNANAQETPSRSAFRNGYQRLGLNFLGSKLDNALSPRTNVFNGNLGATTGYCLEFGRNFYFNKNSILPIRFGLDWTYVSLTFNKMDWKGYANMNQNANTYLDGTSIAASVSSRLGPVISVNPVEKLVIDARFQVVPSVYFFDQSFMRNEGLANEQYFDFVDYTRGETDKSYDPESVKNRLSFGVKTGIGITVRRKAIGLAFDYMPGKVKINYDSNEGNGQGKIKANNLQLKLSFSL